MSSPAPATCSLSELPCEGARASPALPPCPLIRPVLLLAMEEGLTAPRHSAQAPLLSGWFCHLHHSSWSPAPAQQPLQGHTLQGPENSPPFKPGVEKLLARACLHRLLHPGWPPHSCPCWAHSPALSSPTFLQMPSASQRDSGWSGSFTTN